MKKNVYSLLVSTAVVFVLQASVSLFAQRGPVASGGDATGSGGSMSFSIGQIDYIAAAGFGGNMNQGLQQPAEFSAPLPVTLISFTAKLNAQNKVDLFWSTATEINNDFFTVERSQDAQKFEFVTKVKGAGNSTTTLKYQALDPLPYSGISYYRLKQTDFDGRFKYSDVVMVDVPIRGFNGTLAVFPNPTTDNVTLSVQNAETKDMSYVLYDIAGKPIIAQQKLSGSQTIIPMADKANATYFIKVFKNGGIVQTFKVMKSK